MQESEKSNRERERERERRDSRKIINFLHDDLARGPPMPDDVYFPMSHGINVLFMRRGDLRDSFACATRIQRLRLVKPGETFGWRD